MTRQYTLEPRGPFSLHSAISFLEGFAPAMHGRGGQVGHLHLAFVPDGERRAAGACVRSQDGELVVEVSGAAEPGAAARQVERILSLDVDGSGFPDVGERDPRHRAPAGALSRAAPGELPVALRGRRLVRHQPAHPRGAGRRRSRRASLRSSASVSRSAARSASPFPAPGVVAELEGLAGLPERKLATLRALAQAAAQGTLDGERLRAMGGEAAVDELQRLPGVGPVHGAGHRRARRRRARLPRDAPSRAWRTRRRWPTASTRRSRADELARRGEAWRPYRSWVGVLLRARPRRTRRTRRARSSRCTGAALSAAARAAGRAGLSRAPRAGAKWRDGHVPRVGVGAGRTERR